MSTTKRLEKGLGGTWEYDASQRCWTSSDGRVVMEEDGKFLLLEHGKKVGEVNGLEDDGVQPFVMETR